MDLRASLVHMIEFLTEIEDHPTTYPTNPPNKLCIGTCRNKHLLNALLKLAKPCSIQNQISIHFPASSEPNNRTQAFLDSNAPGVSMGSSNPRDARCCRRPRRYLPRVVKARPRTHLCKKARRCEKPSQQKLVTHDFNFYIRQTPTSCKGDFPLIS